MRTHATYILSLDQDKQLQLDNLIEKYQAYPVGTGYIDIIVLRDRFLGFIRQLTKLGLAVSSISWWCHATEENKKKYGCPHGYGGPMTQFGWFTEMSHDSEDLREIEQELFHRLENNFSKEVIKVINNKAIAIIENKQTTTYADGSFLTFERNYCLTPGI